MNKACCILTLLLLSQAALSAPAQEGAAPLTWQDCVARALSNNPSLIAAQNSMESARATARGWYNDFTPRVSLSNSYSDSKDSDGSGRWQAQGTASIDVLNLQNVAGARSSSWNYRKAVADRAIASADTRLALRTKFAALILAQQKVRVAETIRDLRKRNSEMISLKYDSGRESKGNMMQSAAELAGAEASLSQALREVRVAQRDMNRQLGLDSFTAITVTGTLTTQNLPDSPAIDSFIERLPQVESLRAAREQSRVSLAEANSTLWPTLSAHYSRSFTDSEYFPKNPGWSAGASVNLPLFGSGPTAAYYRIASARLNLRKADQDLRDGINRVRGELESAWADFANAIDQKNVQRRFLEAARQRNEEALVRYTSGLMTFENWEQVVSDLVNFEQSALRSESDCAVAEAAWERALGKTLEEQ